MNSAPSSTGISERERSVWTRPPMRSRASSTVTASPALRRELAAASPAMPAPITSVVIKHLCQVDLESASSLGLPVREVNGAVTIIHGVLKNGDIKESNLNGQHAQSKPRHTATLPADGRGFHYAHWFNSRFMVCPAALSDSFPSGCFWLALRAQFIKNLYVLIDKNHISVGINESKTCRTRCILIGFRLQLDAVRFKLAL